MLHVDCHTDPRTLGALRSDWSAAIEASTDTGFELPTLDWFRESLRMSIARLTPLVLVATADEALLGIVPLVVEHRRAWGGIDVRVLRTLPGPRGTRCDIPGPHPRTALTAALRCLARRRDWDVLRLDDPRRRTTTRTSLRLARMRFGQLAVGVTHSESVPAMPSLRVFNETVAESTIADRYIAWRRRSPRSWLAHRDPEFRRWLHEAPLEIELASSDVAATAVLTS